VSDANQSDVDADVAATSPSYLGEIRMWAGLFAPRDWMFCQGQLLPIAEYDALFNLIGTTYGGDGQSTFQLPDLQGRVPIHMGTGYYQGQSGGSEAVTITGSSLPQHTHLLMATTSVGVQTSPINNVLAQSTEADLYLEDTPNTSLDADSVTYAGEGQPHDNIQPYQCVNYIISLFGTFPSPS